MHVDNDVVQEARGTALLVLTQPEPMAVSQSVHTACHCDGDSLTGDDTFRRHA